MKIKTSAKKRDQNAVNGRRWKIRGFRNEKKSKLKLFCRRKMLLNSKESL